MKLAVHLDATVEALLAESTPATCPSDPIAKQRHPKALALARLVLDDNNGTSRGRPGRPEFVVIDTTGDPASASSASPAGSPTEAPVGWEYTWPIPIEVPARVIAQMLHRDEVEVHAVIVRNGIVLHAPGELNLGRKTRLANRAQRRAMRGLYSRCAIPGCRVAYDHCKLHHIKWWRHGGLT